MSYTESGVTVKSTTPYDGGLLLRVANTTTADLVQCYVNGSLVAWQSVHEDTWSVDLSGVSGKDIIFLLAVDTANAETNYWDDAFPDSTATNRLKVEIAQLVSPYLPADKWRVYRGDAGDETADRLVYEADIYPGGRFACGFGSYFGEDFGWDGHDCIGFGYNFGYGEFGFDAAMLAFRSDVLPLGAYPVKVTIVDAAGNESTASTDTITLNTYAQPASGLTIASYVLGSDTINFTFTASEDI